MKVLLVLPAAEHLRVTHHNTSVPPRAMLRFSILPLTTVAALTPSHHEVLICDENVQPLDFDVDVDLVGISFMTAIANRAYEIARSFRSRGKIVVGGGYHPTLCPEDAEPHFDALVMGDAEVAWPQLLHDAESGQLKKIYRNETPCELSTVRTARRKLLNKTAHHYATVNAVQAGRGCKHGCRYCSIAAFHNSTYRHRPLAQVLEELKLIPKKFIFVDDNIIADPEYARELFQAMIPLKKTWVSQSSLKIADHPDLLSLAYQAGCRGLFIGIETISEKNLQAVNKGFNDSGGYLQRIKTIRRAGIGIIAGIIVGMDNDDLAVFERTLSFLQKAHIDCLQLNIMTPLPGTPLYESMKRSGRIIEHNWEHYDFRHCVIQPARMLPEQLQQGADWLYHQFYRLDRVLLRTLNTFRTAGLAPAILGWKLAMTYRYDNRREKIVGSNPARAARDPEKSPAQLAWSTLFQKKPRYGVT